jgi:hypothetical protein
VVPGAEGDAEHAGLRIPEGGDEGDSS